MSVMGHKLCHVRFTPNRRHSADELACPLNANSGHLAFWKPRRHSAGGSLEPNSLPLGQGSQVYRFVLTLIEVTCAGVTELPSVKDARHC